MHKIIAILLCLILLLPGCQLSAGIVQAADQAGVRKVRLSWDAIPDAAKYELTVSLRPLPARKKTVSLQPVLTRSNIYTAGVELEFSTLTMPAGTAWWQVRALDVNNRPISAFSTPKRLDEGEFDPLQPLPTAQLDRFAAGKLYQVYAWIPVAGAASYEVRVWAGMSADEEAGGQIVRQLTIDGADAFDLYDETPYTDEGMYWWQVRARDADGAAITDWSQASVFTIQHSGFAVAALGDSITHGGGAVSNPPGDPAYDWTTYAGLPVKNLGRSGDTTSGMAGRFEREVLPFSPKVLIVMGGINDLRGGETADTVIANLTLIREKCRQYNIIPVFATVTPVNPAAIKRVFDQETVSSWQTERHKVNRWIMAQQYNVDVAALLTGRDGLLPVALAMDGLHPDTRGKASIGKAIGRYLRAHFSY